MSIIAFVLETNNGTQSTELQTRSEILTSARKYARKYGESVKIAKVEFSAHDAVAYEQACEAMQADEHVCAIDCPAHIQRNDEYFGYHGSQEVPYGHPDMQDYI